MNPLTEQFIRQPIVRRSAFLIVILAMAAIMFQGLAEQGGTGSDLSPVPDQPLPFRRELVFGMDLSDRPSLEAVQWLDAAGSASYGMVIMPVDADIIVALLNENERAAAFQALDQMMAVTRDTTVALCLDRPATQIEDDVLAEFVVDTLRDRYPDRIAYLTSCAPERVDSWDQAIVGQLRSPVPASPGYLIPLSTGAPVEKREVESFHGLRTGGLRSLAGDTYVAPAIPVATTLSESELLTASEALRSSAQVALILLQPDRALDPVALTESLAGLPLDFTQLPEGFSAVSSPAIEFTSGWESSTVGTITYRRTSLPGEVVRAFRLSAQRSTCRHYSLQRRESSPSGLIRTLLIRAQRAHRSIWPLARPGTRQSCWPKDWRRVSTRFRL